MHHSFWRVVQNGIVYVAKFVGGKMVTARKLLLTLVKCYQSNMVQATLCGGGNVKFSVDDEVDQVPNATLAEVSDVHVCACTIELDTHKVHRNANIPLLVELDVFSAGNVLEGLLNQVILVGFEQPYQPSTIGA
jgi:hypothetical protein